MPWVGPAVIAIAGCYVCVNVLMVAAAALLGAIRALNAVLPRPFAYRHLLVIGRVLAVTGLFLPGLALWHGGSALSPLRAQVWAAPSMHAGAATIATGAQIDLELDSEHALVPASAATDMLVASLAIGLLMTLLPLLKEGRATIRAVCGAHAIRRIRTMRILISDTEQVPFAAWIPGRSFIVLPAALLLRPPDVRHVLRHEGQHHRQGDTAFIYVALLARALFGINPALHWLTRQLFELQEFACDEALARRPGHCPPTYCACLLRVAEAVLRDRRTQLRSFMAGRHALVLKRRVEAALRHPVRPLQAPAAACCSVMAIVLLTALNALIAMPVQDRRLSRAAAERLATATPGSSVGGLTVNDGVLEQLNLLLGTPDGRAFLSASIERMHYYEPGIRAELKKHGLPGQLLAVPLVESGYRNLPVRRRAGAGLWMFVGPTAQRYGLEVSATRDQRLDITAETRAAMNLLSDLQHRFGDWPLALMAYNSGVSQVEAGITAAHSLDAWTLYRSGYGNDPDYLARTTAVMLILAHPRLLD